MEWWEFFRDDAGEEMRYQAFKDRLEAENEGRLLEDELTAADERAEQDKRGEQEIAEFKKEYYRKQSWNKRWGKK
ncbi:MAG: hypothetical protein M0R74_16490 [Dehalococcoidia bacterium]|jgi:hypothetical protein|nr:hypothetical protein [Dehalococcoidia bacterium]